MAKILPIKQHNICIWAYDENCDFWDTDCGRAHCFINEGPKENSYQFCPFCGSNLEVQNGND